MTEFFTIAQFFARCLVWLLMEFAGFFAFILVFGYLLPAGSYYLRYHVWGGTKFGALRIQERRPAAGQVRREIRMSIGTIAIFSLMSACLFELYKAGHTSLYWNIHDYPLWWLPISFLAALVIHDTYFYWTHRFMHWRPVFKYVHAGHHRSISPTPWAIFAFQPLEAFIQFLGIAGIVMFLPMHPVALLAFLWWDTIVNTAGHTGFEMVPKAVSRSRLYKGFNTVTHHDMHHTNMRANFGSFFNIWDRWMGTFVDDEVQPTKRLKIASGDRVARPEALRRAWQARRDAAPPRPTRTPGVSHVRSDRLSTRQ